MLIGSVDAMPLDEATRRLAFLLQRDLRRLDERRDAHTARGEEVTYDSVSHVATYETKSGDFSRRLYGELLATYVKRDRIFRWAWAGRASEAPPTHGEKVFREGQSRGVPQLAMSVVGDLDEDDAKTLARLGALAARAESVHVRAREGELQFLGLFVRARPEGDGTEIAAEDRFSVPPPLPPPVVREVYEPRGDRAVDARRAGGAPRVREPSRALFVPVANAALTALARACPGYRQGLFALTTRAGGAPTVQLVALDSDGLLRALDPPADLVEAAEHLVDADRREGNGPWRKLAARITPKPDGGATLHVDVL